MTQITRPISWIKAARKAFERFPDRAQAIGLAALTIAAEGGKADTAKPMIGLGSGVFEIALPFMVNAFRVIYAVQLHNEIWVIHAFQKKSTIGIKTPQREINLVKIGYDCYERCCNEGSKTRNRARQWQCLSRPSPSLC